MAFGFLHSQYRQLIPEKREKNGCLAFSQACPTSCLFSGFSPRFACLLEGVAWVDCSGTLVLVISIGLSGQPWAKYNN
jgi:hypothetical protein